MFWFCNDCILHTLIFEGPQKEQVSLPKVSTEGRVEKTITGSRSFGQTALDGEVSSGWNQADPSCRHVVCIAWEIVSTVSKTRARPEKNQMWPLADGSQGAPRSLDQGGPRDITCQMAHSLTHTHWKGTGIWTERSLIWVRKQRHESQLESSGGFAEATEQVKTCKKSLSYCRSLLQQPQYRTKPVSTSFRLPNQLLVRCFFIRLGGNFTRYVRFQVSHLSNIASSNKSAKWSSLYEAHSEDQ